MSTQIELEPGWVIRRGKVDGVETWHSVFHYCKVEGVTVGHICYIPSIVPEEKPVCSYCHIDVPDKVLGMLNLCRWGNYDQR